VYRNIVKTSYLWGGISEKNVPMMTKVWRKISYMTSTWGPKS
jgi:hypothetical protein